MPSSRTRHVVTLGGGLGNQMFQFAFGSWLAETTGLPVRYDCSHIRRVGPAEPLMDLAHPRVHGDRLLPGVGGRFPRAAEATRSILGPTRIINDPSPAGQEHDWSIPSWWFGYWQRQSFAAIVRGQLRSTFDLQDDDFGYTAVHVRRTDYVDLGLAMESKWYSQAVDLAAQAFGPSRVVVVSDDPAWCREHLVLPTTFEVTSGSVLTDFRTLAGARTLVASDSTFSWWASYLGDTQVVHPASGVTSRLWDSLEASIPL